MKRWILPLLSLSIVIAFPVANHKVHHPTNSQSSFDSVAILGVGDLRLHDRPQTYDAIAILLTDENIRSMPSAKTHTIDTVKLLHAAYVDIESQNSNGRPMFFCQDLANLPTADEYQVCDLGRVDNALGYGAYSALCGSSPPIEQDHTIALWNDFIREEPWRNVQQFQGGTFPEYQRTFVRCIPSQPPLDDASKSTAIFSGDKEINQQVPTRIVPSFQDLLERFIRVLDLDDATTLEASVNTGLFATHWGGLDPSTVAETQVKSQLAEFANQSLDPQPPLQARINEYSLEHKAMEWQQQSAWMIPGESMVRFLTAPLLLGTVSARRLLNISPPLDQYMEAREWHKLLAAATIQQQPCDGVAVRYWRWNGFLCRYVESSCQNNVQADKIPALILVHGFGASGTQWLDLIRESMSYTKCYAPDQLGFGHAEKPGVSYTAYLWDSMLSDFANEVVQKQYVAAGNSIGGFTSLSLAASDSATAGQLSSNGAPGTGRCVGLVLCNSAGNIVSKSEASDVSLQPKPSIAAQTASGTLPKCRPPPRFVARAFGNFLLSQLRPRIQPICKNLYPINPEAVDAELCEEIARDSLDPGAIHVMMSGSKLPPPRTANELLNADFASGNAQEESTFNGPVLIAQGILDPLNDAKDRMQRYGALRKGITTQALQAGHCPHDEVPDKVATAIKEWMRVEIAQASLLSTSTSSASII